ncbi:MULTISPECIES: hypothetical protein [unclassified Clostridioides]|uniref:hypothetical protein n=1 Tax=unclassified Clostridioides TaxID=2635829 RepID=UPI001D12AEC3|nr:hypothetical protein [Clostridioides sp. ES-S-0049-03]MCC0678206.1 hypothetical protein [Clostridioides sp. ES-W-0018-02]MCC0713052.1 hypothetical protein [Clostridioides sp. ES-W-0017-02]
MSGKEIISEIKSTQVLKDSDKDTILGGVFADITMSENENLKELVINISKLDDKHINNLNEIVKGLI